MIFSWFSRVVLKLGDESHIFDRERIMLNEVMEIEKLTGLSYMEWRIELERFSMKGIAPLLHILRKRDGQASDFATMQFNVAALDVLALRDDDTEMTGAEMLADIERRKAEAEAEANPTPGADAASPAVPPMPDTTGTSHASPNGTGSGPGSSTGSPGETSSSSKPTPTGA